jgi:ParB family transcriptional regulator, chromosome partitioning protein
MNNTIKKTPITVEQHCLDLAYAPIRLYQRTTLNKLVTSIEQHGQLVPVVIVERSPQQWVLVDGYLRLKALERLGKDTIAAEVWDCDLLQALLRLLAEYQSHPFEALEEALLIRELQTQYGLSQYAISERIGRDKSWVCRRLSLIEHVPDFILKPVLNGMLSLWAAQRILIPLARANTTHAEKLLQYLLKNHTSTRELQSFYDYYQGAHSQERSKMVNEPGLFFKAQKLLRITKEGKNLRLGPEGRWQAILALMTSQLKQLIELAPQTFYPHQALHEHQWLLTMFHQTKSQFDLLTEIVGKVINVN